MTEGYCIRCEMKRDMVKVRRETMANGRTKTIGECHKCGRAMVKIESK